MSMTQSEKDLNAFMAIAQEQAIAEAKLMPTTPDIKRRAHVLAEFARDKLAEMAREERAKRPSNVVSGKIRDWILALSPVEALAKLTMVCTTHPEMQFAHRDYEHVPPMDVYSALEDAMSLLEQKQAGV
jgi:hypothetical protein